MNIGKERWFFDEKWFAHDFGEDLNDLGYYAPVYIAGKNKSHLEFVDIVEICNRHDLDVRVILNQYIMKERG